MMLHSFFMNLLTCLLGLFELAFFEGFQRKLSCMLSTHVLVFITSFSKIFVNKWRFMEGTTWVIGECALIMVFIGLWPLLVNKVEDSILHTANGNCLNERTARLATRMADRSSQRQFENSTLVVLIREFSGVEIGSNLI